MTSLIEELCFTRLLYVVHASFHVLPTFLRASLLAAPRRDDTTSAQSSSSPSKYKRLKAAATSGVTTNRVTHFGAKIAYSVHNWSLNMRCLKTAGKKKRFTGSRYREFCSFSCIYHLFCWHLLINPFTHPVFPPNKLHSPPDVGKKKQKHISWTLLQHVACTQSTYLTGSTSLCSVLKQA